MKNSKYVFIDVTGFLINERTLQVAQGERGEHNVDPVAMALLSKIVRAGYTICLTATSKHVHEPLREALRLFNRGKEVSVLPPHQYNDRDRAIRNFLDLNGSTRSPIIFDEHCNHHSQFNDSWVTCGPNGVSSGQIRSILQRLYEETHAPSTLTKKQRAAFKVSVAASGLNFTYLRKYDAEGNLLRHGGAVVAWKIDNEKFDHHSVKYAIARCYHRDPFDKLRGRMQAIEVFRAGEVGYFPVPANGHISDLIKSEFRGYSKPATGDA